MTLPSNTRSAVLLGETSRDSAEAWPTEIVYTLNDCIDKQDRSRRTRNCCGQQVLDHHKLPSAFRLQDRALRNRVILVLDS